MTPSHLQYAESLKADLLTANQPFSAEIVARLLQERAELMAALEMLTNTVVQLAPYPPEVAEGVIAIVDISKSAITKARGA